MRKRVSAVLLCFVLAASGCGSSKPNEELDKITNEIDVESAGTTDNETVKSEAEDTADSESGDTPEQEKETYYVSFEANTVEGEAWNSDKLADAKMTMINVWATYCNPCLSEMPDLGELAAEYDAETFQIIGVVSDVMEGDAADNVQYARDLIAETKADYPHLLLNESLYMSFVGAVSAVPTTFFVAQDGSMLGYLTGAQSKENWKLLIDQLLSELE